MRPHRRPQGAPLVQHFPLRAGRPPFHVIQQHPRDGEVSPPLGLGGNVRGWQHFFVQERGQQLLLVVLPDANEHTR